MINIERVQNKNQLEDAFRIRRAVFVEEQGVAEEVEIDEYEPIAEHVLVYVDGEAAGTGRVRFVDGASKLERICVLASHRMHRIGKRIMQELEAIAAEKGAGQAKLNGQVQAVPFYEKLGYRIASEEFMEENIPHVKMIKDLRH